MAFAAPSAAMALTAVVMNDTACSAAGGFRGAFGRHGASRRRGRRRRTFGRWCLRLSRRAVEAPCPS